MASQIIVSEGIVVYNHNLSKDTIDLLNDIGLPDTYGLWNTFWFFPKGKSCVSGLPHGDRIVGMFTGMDQPDKPRAKTVEEREEENQGFEMNGSAAVLIREIPYTTKTTKKLADACLNFALKRIDQKYDKKTLEKVKKVLVDPKVSTGGMWLAAMGTRY